MDVHFYFELCGGSIDSGAARRGGREFEVGPTSALRRVWRERLENPNSVLAPVIFVGKFSTPLFNAPDRLVKTEKLY